MLEMKTRGEKKKKEEVITRRNKKRKKGVKYVAYRYEIKALAVPTQ